MSVSDRPLALRVLWIPEVNPCSSSCSNRLVVGPTFPQERAAEANVEVIEHSFPAVKSLDL